jgi:hypothetical protein
VHVEVPVAVAVAGEPGGHADEVTAQCRAARFGVERELSRLEIDDDRVFRSARRTAQACWVWCDSD